MGYSGNATWERLDLRIEHDFRVKQQIVQGLAFGIEGHESNIQQ